MRARLHLGLVLLEARRSVPPHVLVPAFALLVLVAAPGWSPPAALAQESAAALHRQGVWTAFLVFLPPLLVLRAAGTARRWRAREAGWIAPTPLARGAALASGLLGGWIGAGTLTLIAALVVEGSIQNDGEALRRERTVASEAFVLSEENEMRRCVLTDSSSLPAGARLRVTPTVAPGSGPAVTAHLRLTTEDGEVLASAQRRISGRTAIDLLLQESGPDTPLALELTRAGPGAMLVLPPGAVELLVPAGSRRRTSAVLALRFLMALAGWLALAAGLGGWMRPGLGALGTLAIVVAATQWETSRALVPGADLLDAWHLVGRGLVPPMPGVSAGTALALSVFVGCALLATGVRQTRCAA